MSKTWHNNAISKILNEEFKKDFTLIDIDGAVRCHYKDNGIFKTRFIIYESKWKNERKMKDAQLKSLKQLRDIIDWSKFDRYSGLFVFKVIDIKESIIWYSLEGVKIRETTIKELYDIFSCKTY